MMFFSRWHRVAPMVLVGAFAQEQDDDAEAMRWFRQAAEQGDADAQFNLAVMYYNGEGVPQELVLAHMWVNIAGTNGNERARKARDAIEREMTRDKVTRATELARACLASDYRNCEP